MNDSETGAKAMPHLGTDSNADGNADGNAERSADFGADSSREARAALFRAHAAARFHLDTTEANRLAATLRPEHRMAHLLFHMTLFAQVVIDEWGSAPDPGDLADLTRGLHAKHFAKDRNFNALKAEAMIRAVCGESLLLTEIPQAEQPGYMWAVMNELVRPDTADADLAERFEVAEEVGLDWLKEAFEKSIRIHPMHTAPAETDAEVGCQPKPEPEATSAAATEPPPVPESESAESTTTAVPGKEARA